MARKEFPRKVRKAAIDRAAGKCEKCSAVLKKGEAEVDHILPDILGGEPVLVNAQVLCRICHAEKSADDIRRTRKADRARDKSSGAVRPAGKIKSAPFSRTEKAARREARAVTKLSLPPRLIFWPTNPDPELRESSE